MRCKRRFMHGKRLKRSIAKKLTQERIKNIAKGAIKVAKPLARGVAGKALGAAGLVLGATKTSTADTINVVKDGMITNKYTGKTSKSLF